MTTRLIDIQKSSLQDEQPTALQREPAILQDVSVPNQTEDENDDADADERHETNARQKQFVESLNLDRCVTFELAFHEP